jgi:hypothetical protein
MNKMLIVLLLFFSALQPCQASPPPQDVITGFLTEYTENKPTGTVIQVEINILKINTGIYWALKQVTIMSGKYDQSILLIATDLNSDNSEKETGSLFLRDIKWEPGKSFSCTFLPDEAHGINFHAKKIPNTRFGWDVICNGKVKLAGSMKSVPWEWKYSKEIELKFNKVRLANLYRN